MGTRRRRGAADGMAASVEPDSPEQLSRTRSWKAEREKDADTLCGWSAWCAADGGAPRGALDRGGGIVEICSYSAK
jgi:hypothetical protein